MSYNKGDVRNVNKHVQKYYLKKTNILNVSENKHASNETESQERLRN